MEVCVECATQSAQNFDLTIPTECEALADVLRAIVRAGKAKELRLTWTTTTCGGLGLSLLVGADS
jgi:hypothetical protein